MDFLHSLVPMIHSLIHSNEMISNDSILQYLNNYKFTILLISVIEVKLSSFGVLHELYKKRILLTPKSLLGSLSLTQQLKRSYLVLYAI